MQCTSNCWSLVISFIYIYSYFVINKRVEGWKFNIIKMNLLRVFFLVNPSFLDISIFLTIVGKCEKFYNLLQCSLQV